MAVDVVFATGAIMHLVFALVFVVIYGWAVFEKRYEQSAISGNAIVVALITHAVYWVQFAGLGFIARSDGRDVYFLEWIGYAFSLFLIAKSLAMFLQAQDAQELTPSYYLLLVGAGGVLGTFIPQTLAGAQWAVLLSTTGVYVVFFVELARRGSLDRTVDKVLYVYFIVVTLLTYVLFYVLGAPVLGVASATVEHAFYLVGNFLSKFLLPILEVAFFQSTRVKKMADM